MLKIHKKLPDDFITLKSFELYRSFESLDIVELGVDESPLKPLFISFMLHGNEPSGLVVVQKIIQKYLKSEGLPRPIILMLGNLGASKNDLRREENGPDFNRIWRQKSGSLIEFKAQQVMEYLRSKNIFVAIDIHNNTGTNPSYACINKMDLITANIAKSFNNLCVHFQYPDSALSVVMSQFCPAVTLECGLPLSEDGIERAFHLVDELLNRDELATKKVQDHELEIYHTHATIRVPEENSISFNEDNDADFSLRKDFDKFNFKTLKVGDVIGYYNNPEARLVVEGVDGADLSQNYFDYVNGKIVVKKAYTPSMISCVSKIVKQDCLSYIMESYSLELLK